MQLGTAVIINIAGKDTARHRERHMGRLAHLAFAAALLPASAAVADWQPSKPVEFVVTAGAGGGTDLFARAVQAAFLAHGEQQRNVRMRQLLLDQRLGERDEDGAAGAVVAAERSGSVGDDAVAFLDQDALVNSGALVRAVELAQGVGNVG